MCTAILLLAFFQVDNIKVVQPFAIERPSDADRVVRYLSTKGPAQKLKEKGVLAVKVHDVLLTKPYPCVKAELK